MIIERVVQGIAENRSFTSNLFPSERMENSSFLLFLLARRIGTPACSDNPLRSAFQTLPSHDRPALHSTRTVLPFLMHTRSIGFDDAARMTRYPSRLKISRIRYSSLLPMM